MRRKLVTFTALATTSAAAGYGLRFFQERNEPPALRWHTGASLLPPGIPLEKQLEASGKSTAMQLSNHALLTRAKYGYNPKVNQLLSSAYSMDPANEIIRANYMLSCLAEADIALQAHNNQLALQWLDKAQALRAEIRGKQESTSYIAEGYCAQRLASTIADPKQKAELLKKAADLYKIAHSIDAKNKVIFCLLGEAHLDLAAIQKNEIQAQSFQKAIEFFEQAIQLDKSYGLAHFRLGETEIKSGKMDAGKEQIRQAFDFYLAAPKNFPKEFQDNNDAFFKQIPEFSEREAFISSLKQKTSPVDAISMSPR